MTKGLALEDYNSPSVTFVVRRCATPATVIAQLFPEANLLLFDEDGATTQEVLNGNAFATMMAEPSPWDGRRIHLLIPPVRTVDFDPDYGSLGARDCAAR